MQTFFLYVILFFSIFQIPLSATGVTYEGSRGPGMGKHIVFLVGDDGEYHSEEGMPQLAKILAVHHGFTCTILFSLSLQDGTIDPFQNRSLSGLEILRKADLLVLFIRWRDLPDDQMKQLDDYFNSGKPIIAIRAGTHPFQLKSSTTYAKYSWNNTIPGWEGGIWSTGVG